jgi:TRAP-type C4-dicarboxylate transport system permease small subunit
MEKEEHQGTAFSGTVEKIERILISLCALLLAAITVIILLSVFYRYVLGNALSWSEEAGRFLVIFVGLAGAAIALHKDEHASFTAVLNRFPAWLQKACRVLNYSLIALFAGIMLVYGTDLAFDSGATAEIIPMPMWIPLLSVPFSGGIMLLVALMKIISELRR